MSTEEVKAALDNLNSRWCGSEPMTALLEDALQLRVQLKGKHELIPAVDEFISRANRCIRFGPG